MARVSAKIDAARWTIIDARDGSRWLRALARLPRHDLYHLPDHNLAYANGPGARALAYVCEYDGGLLFHPFLLRDIDRVGDTPVAGGLCDIETVYGYAGPLATRADAAFLEAAWAGYDAWCRTQSVVCEFMRFHPWLDNQDLAPPDAETWRDRQTVAVDLGDGEDGLWRGYAGAHRNSLRKARKSGLVCHRESAAEGMAAFTAIYRETMRGLDADPFYDFDDAYFAALIDGARCHLFMVTLGDKPIAGALFLSHGEVMHYHLAGSLHAYRDLAPNNLLIHEAACWGIALGCRWLHLGGGRTPAPTDTLFRFKARFSPHRRDLWLGKRIVDAAAYADLCARWRARAPDAPAPRYTQLYRLDPSKVTAT